MFDDHQSAEAAQTAESDTKESIKGLPWKRLWGFTEGQRWRFIIIFFTTLIGAAAGLLFPYLIGQGIEGAVESKSYSQLNELTLVLLALFVIQSVATYFEHYYLTYVGETVVVKLRKLLYDKLLFLDMGFHANHKSGELASRISSDTNAIQTIFTQMLPNLLGSVISIVGTIVVMLSLNTALTLFIFGIVPVMVVVMLVLGKIVQKLGTRNQDMIAANTAMATESIKNISVVKSFTAEEHESARYQGSLKNVFDSMVKTSRVSSLNMSIIMFLAFSAIAAIVWFAGRQAIDGTLTIGLITTFLIYGLTMAMTFASLSQIYSQMRQATGSSRRVFEIIDHDSALSEPEVPKKIRDSKNISLAMNDVSFSYGEAVALNDTSITVESGKITALVGPSGSGKTTAFELFLRYYDPTKGSITMNGIDIRELGSKELRSHIAVVSQNAPLFSGTVYDNIAYGSSQKPTKKQVVTAAKAAQADSFIRKLPNGYDTVLGESGIGLSGGQRQRIAIARAVIKDAPVLLLDEATSALDTKSEHLVQQALDTLMQGRTTLTIAHRLSTIINADTIFVMADGGILESGSHAELLKHNGLYAELYSQQHKKDSRTA